MNYPRSFLFAIALAGCTGDESPHRDPRFAPLAQAVEDDLARNAATGASVAVWFDDEVVWVGGYGAADPEVDDVPPDENTLFDIGSDTKKITAIALLQQIAAGRATLDTTVGEVLPLLQMQAAPEFTGATIRQLLSHQSGIVDGAEFTTSTTDDGLASYSYGEFATTYTAMAAPGTFWNYSNPNFSIAGLIDQQLADRPWADLVEDDFFTALAMTRTVARRSEVDDNHAPGNGYTVGSDETGPIHRIALADTWESAFVRPAGLVWSTPSDQMKLARFLVDGDPAVLAPALLAEVTAPQVPMYPDLPQSYGFGLILSRGLDLGDAWYDVPVWSHGGQTRSHSSTFFILPEQRFAISILSNGVDDDFTASVVAAMGSLVNLPATGVRPEPPFVPAELDGLTGTYADTTDGTEVVITRVGDVLHIAVSALDDAGVPYDHAMQHVSTRVWLATVDGTTLDFAFIDAPTGEMYMRNRDAVLVRH